MIERQSNLKCTPYTINEFLPKYSKKAELLIFLHNVKKAIEPLIDSGTNNGTKIKDAIFAVDAGMGNFKNNNIRRTYGYI